MFQNRQIRGGTLEHFQDPCEPHHAPNGAYAQPCAEPKGSPGDNRERPRSQLLFYFLAFALVAALGAAGAGVGLRLGCINHALLTARAIRDDRCELLGWIASTLDPAMLRMDDNLATLRARLDAPYLGALPFAHARDPAQFAAFLDAACACLAGAP